MSKTTGITAVSYIGDPKPNTAMYVTAKVEQLCENLRGVRGCLVFAEEGIAVAPGILAANEFRFSANPLLEYVEFTTRLQEKRNAHERSIPWRKTAGGALVSESAYIDEGAYLEAGVVIGPGVTIGPNATILAGAVVRHSTIGANVVINEHAVVGAQGFTMARDAAGDLMRIPTLGGVEIGDNVEIGAHDNISCGSAGNTTICDFVKLDALVHVGHDAYIGKNVEVTAGAVLGGFCRVGGNSFVGVGAVIRNRIEIGKGTTIGMGAVVTKSVIANSTVVGNPARPLEVSRG